MVVQLSRGACCGEAARSGPPARPSGSIVAVMAYERFGSVGPSAEQKYMSQIVKARASAK